MKYSDTKGPISLSSVPEDSIGHRIPGSKKDIECAIVEVTPEMAREWLKKNRSNRKVREDRVDRYAEQMRDGEWMVSPDAIAFSYTDKLINGQHRLKAITQLGRGESVECLVAFGLDPGAFKIADVGVKRTGADVLRIEGFKSPEEKAAVCRLLALWHQSRLEELNQYENVRNSVIVDIATTSRERLTETIEKVGSDKKALNGLMPRSLMAFAYFAYKPTFPERAEFFLNGLMFEKNYPAIDWEEAYEKGVKNPIKLLKDKMRPNYKELSRKAKLALLVKAMNRYCLERPLKQLRWRSNEDFPELAAKKPEAEQDLFS
ncbi:hypothetical protein [Salinibacter ruber]|uniref:hypothetical protein n=1 Tax=Salinibacter ruber TaxID=146919 RepID=UPI002167BC0F|nr:hypothetical protein [Salinibacter ruber]MCS4051282.1 hypothetical protein [Salinibacter ruber]